MNIKDLFNTAINPHPFVISQYKTPQQYLDPGKIIQQRKNKSKRQFGHGKFKPSKRNKQFFIDQLIEPFVKNPSPDKYKTTLDLLEKGKKGKKVTNIMMPKAIKNTYIDQIQIKQAKQKAPGIGKYNLLTLTDFNRQSGKKLKFRQNPQKNSYFNDFKYLSAKIPGPGQHNPHDQIKKVKTDRTTYKFYQQKHKKQELKIKRSQSAKLGPSTYNPVSYNTFDSIKTQAKNKIASKWTHGTIQIRKGLKSAQKHPGPAQYLLINQWTQSNSSGWRNKPELDFGKVDLFHRTSRSTKSLNIYRD